MIFECMLFSRKNCQLPRRLLTPPQATRAAGRCEIPILVFLALHSTALKYELNSSRKSPCIVSFKAGHKQVPQSFS